jgi:hypothetical protein
MTTKTPLTIVRSFRGFREMVVVLLAVYVWLLG